MSSPFEPDRDSEEFLLQHCDAMEDETHCNHWWDAVGPCCACGKPTIPMEAEGSQRDAAGVD